MELTSGSVRCGHNTGAHLGSCEHGGAHAAACCCWQTVGGGGGGRCALPPRPPLAPWASRALPIARRRARGSTDYYPLSAAVQPTSATLPLCLSDSDCGWGGALPMRPQPLCVAGSGMPAAGTWPGTEQHNPSAAHRPQSKRDSDIMVCPFTSQRLCAASKIRKGARRTHAKSDTRSGTDMQGERVVRAKVPQYHYCRGS